MYCLEGRLIPLRNKIIDFKKPPGPGCGRGAFSYLKSI